VLVAVALIVGAVFIRRAIDDNPSASPATHDGPTRVVCAPEVAAACDDLDAARDAVTIEDAATTAARLSKAGAAIDAWVVPQPWPAIVDDARQRAGLDPLFEDSTVVARSPLVAVGADGGPACDWRCIGGGDARIGAAAPGSGVGLLEAGAVAAGYFGTSAVATNDFDAAFESWLAAFTARVHDDEQPVTRLLLSRAFFDVAISWEADAKSTLDAASADRRAGLALQYPAPMAYLDVAVAESGVPADLAADVGAALHAHGWRRPASTPNGLPKAGVLVALRDLL
jgi:hypothetical protein